MDYQGALSIGARNSSNAATHGDSQSKRPVAPSENPDKVGAGGSQDIIDCCSRRNNTFTTGSGRSSGEPRNDVSGLLVVKGLTNNVS